MKFDIKDKAFGEYRGFYVWNKPFFLLKKQDERFDEYKNFKKENGFSPDETWCLRTNIALFILPRLKYFKDTKCGYPATLESEKDWDNILDKMIFAFSSSLEDDDFVSEEYLKKYNGDKNKAYQEYTKDIQEGLDLFSKYFFNLWW